MWFWLERTPKYTIQFFFSHELLEFLHELVELNRKSNVFNRAFGNIFIFVVRIDAQFVRQMRVGVNVVVGGKECDPLSIFDGFDCKTRQNGRISFEVNDAIFL